MGAELPADVGCGAGVERVSGVVIRAMQEADLPAVNAIEQGSYSVPWSDVTFRGLLRRRDAELLVAERAERVVGYIVFWQVLDQGELGNVAVSRDARRNGVARQLIAALMERAAARGVHELFLEVRPSNHGARQLYESFGFVPVGQRRNYYQEPVEDAVVMRVLLQRPAHSGWHSPMAGADG